MATLLAALFQGQRSVTASEIADRATIVEMLAFAARHRVVPIVERAPLEAEQLLEDASGVEARREAAGRDRARHASSV